MLEEDLSRLLQEVQSLEARRQARDVREAQAMSTYEQLMNAVGPWRASLGISLPALMCSWSSSRLTLIVDALHQQLHSTMPSVDHLLGIDSFVQVQCL